jgi:hypothetical protein
MWRSRKTWLLVALFACVVAAGCGGGRQGGGEAVDAASKSNEAADSGAADSGAPGSPGGSRQGPSGGAPGAPTHRNPGAVAVGSPIKLPAFQEKGAGNFDEVHQRLLNEIRAACEPKHDLCVTPVVKTLDNDDSDRTCFEGTIPPLLEKENEVPRDKELTILRGKADTDHPCEPQGSGEGGESTGSTETTETTETTGPTDTSQPDDGQSPPPSSS